MQRRDFLKRSLVGLGGASSLWATTSQFNLVNAATSANSFTDYKALVCVFLLGGNDSLNMLIPTDQRAYDQYAATRQNLAVARNAALPIKVTNTQYSSVGLHPSLAALHTIYEEGNMALVANVGPMIEPASKADILTGRVMLPPQLFSHSDQQNHWQTAHPQQAALTGWAGRMADMLSDGTEPLSMNLSMAGNNLWQTGSQVLPFALSSQGAEILEGINPDEEWQRPNAAFLDRIHANTEGMFASQFAAMVDRTRTTGGLVNSALALGPELSTAFPATRFAEQMRLVANMISVQQHLNQPRQIYFVAMGGWDTHDNQLADHPALLSELANGMAAFYNATAELGVSEQVTAFTASDFGRTLTSNGDGTDHGWGGNHIVLGGAVQGADIYGQLPQMSLGSDDDLGDGRIIPTLSVDQYAATLAQWFGLGDNELTEILPNLNNFNQHNLGFLAE
ncbi:MAG TPA: hypothetical protein DEH24_14215 [Alteromonas sp.]|nr:hypothetical protein [Aestuariibacter sp.]MAP22671.1 hypothetical protein [Alteromonadaceae bacterium]MAX41966.1 hypothetical protein [Alteromonadaceae bacterium]HBY40575.1 hypothetical protein [Alteromonas sp.]|tara:strand:- start:20481 stop:21833 length:1353 start_codon:yes stop_codon:yes gene_type:complete